MKYLSLLLVSLGILVIACSDPIEIGSGILVDDISEVRLDTLAVTATTVRNDMVISFAENVQNSLYMVGNLEDDLYGSTEAITYFNAELLDPFRSELSNGSLVDSIVLILVYDTIGQYGADNLIHDLELFQTAEPLNNFFDVDTDTIFSPDEIPLENAPIWSGQLRVNHTDSITIRDHIQDTAGLVIAAELRIPLDVREFTDLFASQTDSIDTELFGQIVPGFALRSSTPNSIIGLDIVPNATVSSSSRIFFYYREDDDDSRTVFGVPLGTVRHNQIVHDDAGSELATEREKEEQDILYLQPQGGAEIEIDLEALLQEDPFILNSAQLEITVVDPIDEDLPLPELLSVVYDQDGIETTILDFSNIIRFDGSPEQLTVDDETLYRYTMDISAHLNLILDGIIEETTIRVIPSPRAFVPNRTRVYGTNHPDHPLTVKIIKTNP